MVDGSGRLLGVELSYDINAGVLYLSQPKHIQDAVDMTGYTVDNPPNPCLCPDGTHKQYDIDMPLHVMRGALPASLGSLSPETFLPSLVGTLLFIARFSRMDIMVAVSRLAHLYRRGETHSRARSG